MSPIMTLPTLKPSVTVRTATPEDIAHVHAIYIHYVLHTATDMHHAPPSLTSFTAEYETLLSSGLPYLVAVPPPDLVISQPSLANAATDDSASKQQPSQAQDPGHPILGFIHAFPFRGYKVGYAGTAELAIMCHPNAVKRGAGSALMQAFLDALEKDGKIEQVLAFMTVLEDEGEDKRVKSFYEKWGFREVGRMEDVGQKFGRR